MNSDVRLRERLVAALAQHLVDGKPVRVPIGGELLWQWFVDLSAGRTFHMAGPNPIGWPDIAAFCQVRRLALDERHIATLRAMDSVFIHHYSQSRGDAPQAPAMPMTMPLFDAVFGGGHG